MSDITNGVPMSFTAVGSSIIDRVAYSAVNQQLVISLRTKRTYIYYGVPTAIYVNFYQSLSRGTFFNRSIKGKFNCQEHVSTPYTNHERVPPRGYYDPFITRRSTGSAYSTTTKVISMLPTAQVFDIADEKYDKWRGRSRYEVLLEQRGDKWAAMMLKHRLANNKATKINYRLKRDE